MRVDEWSFLSGRLRGCRQCQSPSPKRVQYAHAAPVAVLADADEFVGRALEPRRPYLPVIMPNAAELVPHPRVAPQHPLFDKIANDLFVPDGVVHANAFHRPLALEWPPSLFAFGT